MSDDNLSELIAAALKADVATCERCERERPIATFKDGVCDYCRIEDERGRQAEAHAARAADRSWTGLVGERVRHERNRLLSMSDWALVEDAPTNKVAWRAYRKALRDLPASFATPEDVQWPTPPV